MNGVPWGGSEELWSRTAQALRTRGHEVVASVLQWPTIPERVRELAAAGVEIQRRPRERKFPVRLLHRTLRLLLSGPLDFPELWWLRRQRAELVVISQGGPWDGIPWMLACRQLGLPYCAIVQANSEIWWPLDPELDGIRTALGDAARVFFVSHSNRELMERQSGMHLGNAEVVANPLNLAQREEAPWPRETGETHLACVGRLDPAAKGQDVLLQVFAQPRWQERPVRLHLYGTGRGERSVKSLAQLLGLAKVNFHGHVSDVNQIWAENHALVLPSRFEGLPLVIVEAMLCARPVIATDVAGNTEFVQDGKTGFVCPAPTVALLDSTLERAWAARAQWPLIGRQARAHALACAPSDPVGAFVLTLERVARGTERQSAVQPISAARVSA